MNNNTNLEPYENLANAIIIQAAKDYKKILKQEREFFKTKEMLQNKESIERFFLSDWFSTFTNIDGAMLAKKIRLEVVPNT